MAERAGSQDPNSMGVICSTTHEQTVRAHQCEGLPFTSYTMDVGESAVVRFELAGRESAWIIGNGTRCCCHEEIVGTSDHR